MYDKVAVIGGLTDRGSTDHAFQQIYALPPSLGTIPSHLIVLFTSSEGFSK